MAGFALSSLFNLRKNKPGCTGGVIFYSHDKNFAEKCRIPSFAIHKYNQFWPKKLVKRLDIRGLFSWRILHVQLNISPVIKRNQSRLQAFGRFEFYAVMFSKASKLTFFYCTIIFSE